MILLHLVLIVLLAGTTSSFAQAGTQTDMTDCLGCHTRTTPAATRQWQESAHAKARVACADCHGSDHTGIEKGEQRVSTKTCGKCHPKAYDTHTASRHGMGLHSGWGCTRNLENRDNRECAFCHEKGSTKPLSTVQCARFLKQSREMGEIGCNRCHQVESSCASCHTAHITDLRVVRDPNNCATCHMGPDHPQWEMWQTSRHGTLFNTLGEKTGPSCQTCHMVGGSHNVSRGITMSSGMAPYQRETASKARIEMLEVCTSCHSPALVQREFDRSDAVHRQSLAIVKQAELIIAGLSDEKLLNPMPDQRPSHPLSGSKLVLDSQLLYEDTSHIERLLFKMKKYDLAKTVKGAYHQNPAYTHWYGNAELKMDLVDIKSEAQRLRDRKKIPVSSSTMGSYDKTGGELDLLKKKSERGEILPEAAQRQRQQLLDNFLLNK